MNLDGSGRGAFSSEFDQHKDNETSRGRGGYSGGRERRYSGGRGGSYSGGRKGRYSGGSGRNHHRPQRGAQSMSDLTADSVNDQSTGRNGQRTSLKRREHPIGYKVLEGMLGLFPDEVVMKLLREKSGYDLLIDQDDDVKPDKMFLLIKVLSHASETKANRENLYILLSKTFKTKFINQLVKFSLTFGLQQGNENGNIFYDKLWNVLHVYGNVMPSLAADLLPAVFESCIMVLQRMSTSSPDRKSILNKYRETRVFLEQHKKTLQMSGHAQKKTRQRHTCEDNLQPPEDFRELSILPTAQDLNDTEKPFLRRNIVEGKYLDVNHYLDVQFRLLKEDFVRPLREGINAYKGKSLSQNRDIWIYKDVRIVGSEMMNFEMIFYIQLNLPQMFKIESSKRLLFGNLLCFSRDNFCNLIFGSVFDRKPEKLKNGIIGVKFESNIGGVSDSVFVMAESRSYFVAYKHVLNALQDITEDSFPMEYFIVNVHSYMVTPSYVSQRSVYDLNVMRSSSMMKESEACSKLFQNAKRTIKQHPKYLPSLAAVRVLRDLQNWPTEDELGLDASQRRALKSALVSKLAIIQGPPGTGKTFMGLKITQVLLHNSEAWKNEDQPSPILVVCFTNHALDQFLEGMSQYTDSIVRVGSRTKSEIVDRFQINQLVKTLRSQRALPADVHEMNKQLLGQVRELESKVLAWRKASQELSSPRGILKLDFFSSTGIIPDGALKDIKIIGIQDWLLDQKVCEESGMAQFASGSKDTNPTNTNTESRQNKALWQDAEDLFAVEERDRMLDDVDLVDHSNTGVTIQDILGYVIKAESLEREIEVLASYNTTSVNNPESRTLQSKLYFLQLGLKTPPINVDKVKVLEETDVTDLNFRSRWALYRLWLSRLSMMVNKKLLKAEDEFKRVTKAWREIKDQEYLHVMRHASVVGMTTTGAASHSSVVQALQPPIVIIEEAAEILEAHVITSLTGNCQHLIMIGDHQQLQPSATVYELAKKFGLETSLFERMIKNNMAYETLEYQHRMRPCISRLLVPSIYPSLKDHCSVHQYPHVKGITTDIFFIAHSHHEKKGAGDESNSHENVHEAELMLALCRHLMLQGYSPSDVTILTPYTGQFFLLRKVQRKYQVCHAVRISVVDNFQGEESNIILLSLVRSNEEQKVGFLSSDNRVCVALSRAKHGLYITGNMDQLRMSSDLWKKVEADLSADESLGKSLTLRCENHRDQMMSVTTGLDILRKSPEGGCLKPCSSSLPKCGHSCPMICHISDMEHREVKCRLPCPNTLCERDHPCPGECWEACEPCRVHVPKTLPCGHTHRVLCCSFNKEFKCPTIVEKDIPACEHRVKMPCFMAPEMFTCPVSCAKQLECGHTCKKNCHVTNDPDHTSYKCKEQCSRLPKDCSRDHPCKMLCHEECKVCTIIIKKKAVCGHQHEVQCCVPKEDIKCYQKCRKMLECGHHCPKKCFEKCGGCQVKVKKVIPDCNHEIQVMCCNVNNEVNCPIAVDKMIPGCHHSVKMACYIKPETLPCPTTCDIRLECGHKCIKICHITEDPDHLNYQCKQQCTRLLEGCSKDHPCKMLCHEDCNKCTIIIKKDAICGHQHEVQCCIPKEDIKCYQNCRKMLECGHQCPKKCVEKCGGCQVKVKKMVPDCNHEIQIECSQPPHKSECNGPCVLQLACGHPCGDTCSAPCTTSCRARVPSSLTCPKKHLIEVPCFRLNMFSENEEAAWRYCMEPCGTLLECGHVCRGQCGRCLHGRLHTACAHQCGKPLVCGHVCKEDCSHECPPCQDQCPLRCVHSRCSSRCGKPCKPCQERCLRKCEHQECGNLCGEKCSISPCKEACPKRLECDHPCVGFCGEPCPPLCRTCNNEQLTEILFGFEDEENARFVWLEDCGHTIEAEGLEAWLSQEGGEVGMKMCPRCKKPIYNNRRFYEYLLKAYEDVEAVKLMYFKKKTHVNKEDILRLLEGTTLGSEFTTELKKLETLVKTSFRQLCDSQLTLIQFQVQVLNKANLVLEQTQKIPEYNNSQISKKVKFVVKRVMQQNLRIAPQMMQEVTCELQRLSVLPVFWSLTERYTQTPNVSLSFICSEILMLLEPTAKFDSERETKIRGLLKESEEYIGGLGITKLERLQVVRAMGLKQGHWYKCPKGHIYCITECGGAMEKSKCPDCGLAIGGGSHQLLADNALASEMDGAQYSAWSEQNNMANYDIPDME
ncbi:NFX1-type zinc finger-containing protein 1 [Procambarus clarkii]|uniref:NFX1-type zinc finger-containing protein 1 n=1 Tax=Procambarus clarkii TaxID=6728 RepID=UPI0037438C2F